MSNQLSNVAAVVGIGHTDWRKDYAAHRAGEAGKLDSIGLASLAFTRALKDAGISRDEVDGLIVGPTTPYERMGEVLGIDARWGGQADAMLAVMQATMAIHAGLAEVVALVYGNNQRTGKTNYGGANAAGGASFLSYVYHAPWGFTSQGALYALMFQRYMEETGLTSTQLGEVAVAQRLAASLNPEAVMQKRITVEDYLASDFVCEPLHLFDYCLVNDGGVALIIMSAERARKLRPDPVMIHGVGRYDLNRGATSLEPRLTEYYLPAQQKVAAQVFDMAGVGPEDISSAQIYDSFSCHIPLALEGYGYCAPGEAGRFMQDGNIKLGGRLPVNTSGGHLSESYMQGWGHQIEAVRQIRGTCGERQVENCRFVHYSSDVAGKAVSIIYGR
ncbi:thiolase family protein [Neorhizobium alkalisoli]|uniref:Acetyl-CoA acetyltransferase n=1 Tax=Neorhizobium alkalisoli TaxID=528178 RepID=A0A561QAP8_9HYPH|nr:thiolase family protein [Neorhizobium alkalisoli]TWF47435.1 acetyl-CoA acetyltransferase [Neorhizobium alkalisoli]